MTMRWTWNSEPSSKRMVASQKVLLVRMFVWASNVSAPRQDLTMFWVVSIFFIAWITAQVEFWCEKQFEIRSTDENFQTWNLQMQSKGVCDRYKIGSKRKHLMRALNRGHEIRFTIWELIDFHGEFHSFWKSPSHAVRFVSCNQNMIIDFSGAIETKKKPIENFRSKTFIIKLCFCWARACKTTTKTKITRVIQWLIAYGLCLMV